MWARPEPVAEGRNERPALVVLVSDKLALLANAE
jgi:hypothetical protein